MGSEDIKRKETCIKEKSKTKYYVILFFEGVILII